MIEWRRRNIYIILNSVSTARKYVKQRRNHRGIFDCFGMGSLFSDCCFVFFPSNVAVSLWYERCKQRKKSSKAGKKIDENWYILLYKTIMRAMQCCLNGEHAKRFGNRREDNKKRKKTTRKNWKHFTFTTVCSFFFLLFQRLSMLFLYACILRSFSLYWSLFTRGNIRVVCFFCCCSARFFCISVGLLLKKQINLAAPNFFFFL